MAVFEGASAEDLEIVNEGDQVQETTDQPVDVQDTPTDFNTLVKDKTGFNDFDSFLSEYNKVKTDSENRIELPEGFKPIYDHFKREGNLDAYFQAYSKDYESMSAEAIMRHDLRERYPDLDDDIFEALYDKNVVQKFGLNSEDEKAKKLAQIELNEATKKLREKYKSQQAEMIPKGEQVDFDAIRKEVEGVEGIAEFKENKLLNLAYKIGNEEKAFNYEVADPNEVIDMTVDATKFWAKFQDEKGNVDMEKWKLVASIAQDPHGFIQAIANHARDNQTDIITDELVNPAVKPTGNPNTGEPKSLAEAFLRSVNG